MTNISLNERNLLDLRNWKITKIYNVQTLKRMFQGELDVVYLLLIILVEVRSASNMKSYSAKYLSSLKLKLDNIV